jgi:hypothetical protein
MMSFRQFTLAQSCTNRSCNLCSYNFHALPQQKHIQKGKCIVHASQTCAGHMCTNCTIGPHCALSKKICISAPLVPLVQLKRHSTPKVSKSALLEYTQMCMNVHNGRTNGINVPAQTSMTRIGHKCQPEVQICALEMCREVQQHPQEQRCTSMHKYADTYMHSCAFMSSL